LWNSDRPGKPMRRSCSPWLTCQWIKQATLARLGIGDDLHVE